MKINDDWTMNDLLYNIKRLKEEYLFNLAFFSSSIDISIKRKVINVYIKMTRNSFYKLNIKEWQIDKCWEYMNDDICYNDLYYVFNKIEKNKKLC